MIQYIKEKGVLSPQPLNQWQMIPQDWTRPAAERDLSFFSGNEFPSLKCLVCDSISMGNGGKVNGIEVLSQ